MGNHGVAGCSEGVLAESRRRGGKEDEVMETTDNEKGLPAQGARLLEFFDLDAQKRGYGTSARGLQSVIRQ